MILENLLFFNKKGDQYNFQFNGTYWEGSVLFPIVSEKLFEIEHIFIIEKFLDSSSNIKYGYPHSEGISGANPVWRSRWESDYDNKLDVSSIIYTYELGVDTTLDSPVLVNSKHVEFLPEDTIGDSVDILTGLVVTNSITSSSMQINIALNSDNEGIYDRTLIFEDYTDPSNPITILKVNFHGEVEGEDSRLSVLLGNFGRDLLSSDAYLLRESDIQEPFPDFEIINRKRKELLLTGESIFPYIGSYKSLFNAIKFFGYYDLRIKEYWLNIKKDSAETMTAGQQNNDANKQLGKLNTEGVSTLELIKSYLKDENEGKFKQVEIYGKNDDGTFGLKKSYDKIFPSKSYKKTSLFGLFYDINKIDAAGEEDAYGYPIVDDAFVFSPEEVLMKLFGLRERLKRDYLPLNARIIDITGEGVYFNIYKTRGWVDQLNIDEVKVGIEVDFKVFPEKGYIEDLRVFYTKPNQDSILYPNINGTELGISHYGNDIEPYSFSQQYPSSNIPLLNTAINKFYDDVNNGIMPSLLGDGDYDPTGYKMYSTGKDHYLPAGCPVILQNTTFDLSWDEVGGSWAGINDTVDSMDLSVSNYSQTQTDNPGAPLDRVISTDSIDLSSLNISGTIIINIGTGNDWFIPDNGKNIFVRVQSDSNTSDLLLGSVDDSGYNTSTGDLIITILSVRGSDTYNQWTVSPSNISTNSYTSHIYQNWIRSGGFYSWANIKYLDFYEIEWTIFKEDGVPYHFQIQGDVKDLEYLPHFLPYTGKYHVHCRLWDTLNSISLGVKRSVIEVTGRNIELNTLTRYRQSESYNWDYMPLKWDTYESQWLSPVETTDLKENFTSVIENFPEYGNNFNEGQECEVLTKIPEVKAVTSFEIGAISISITDITSTSGNLARATTTTPHGYLNDQYVWIYYNDGTSYGKYKITVIDSITFEIPEILSTPLTGLYSYGDGNIKVILDGKTYADCDFQGDVASTASSLFFIISNTTLKPKYKILSIVDSTINIGYKKINIQAPEDSGELWNDKLLTIQKSGSILVDNTTHTFSGGSNEKEEYVSYDFSTPPVGQMKYWGSKNLSWDTFEDFQFSKAYAHSWDMMDYHNDFPGGFNLYSLQYGDRIRISKNTEGIVLKETDSPSNGYLDLMEAADQLNSSTDENISRFTYVVRNYSTLPGNFGYDAITVSPDLSTFSGPKNISTEIYNMPEYTPLAYIPSDLAWDGDGDIWVTGEDVVKFDGLNYTTYNSTNSVLPGIGIKTNTITIDRNDKKWIGINSSLIPLAKIDDLNPGNSISYSVSDFVDNTGASICPNSLSTINCIEINTSNGDIFASFKSDLQSAYDGLLQYDDSAKSWRLYTTANSGIPSGEIRDLKLEFYEINKWYLWITTDNGLSRFDGVDFRNYDINNSGIISNDLYSLEIDKLGHKWLGSDSGLCYWDHVNWTLWNNITNPELGTGKIVNIIDSGNSNIWFMLDTSTSPGNSELYFFDGYNFTKNLYRNDGTTLLNPRSNYYGKSVIIAPWKTIKNGIITYPKNLIGLTESGELFKIDYVIPHIHAVSKFPGTSGWDFVYHESMKKPIMNSVDKYTWSKPNWHRYSVDYLKDQFPSINLDDVFLYAPLRDILSGSANKEEYWKNAPIERIADKKSRDIFQDFEWVITLGDSSTDKGIKTAVDTENDLITIGNFTGTIFMGSVNNINSNDVYLTTTLPGVFIGKYNSSGILQWAREIAPATGEGSILARSIITDKRNNIYIVSDNSTIGFIQIDKYNSEGDLLNTLRITITDNQFIGDIKADKYENLYITGSFKGTLVLGSNTLVSLSNESGFVAKIDPTLTFVWSDKIGSSYKSTGYEIASLKEDFIYVTGIFDKDLTLGTKTLTSTSISDLFVAKYNSGNGECLWAESFAKDSSTSFKEPSICMDTKGHVLVTGSFNGTLKIEDKLITSNIGNDDIFILKLLSTGKLIWAKSCGGSSGDRSFDIESDADENVYITGSFIGDSQFSPATVSSDGGDDIFLSKFDKFGNLVDVVTAGGIYNDAGSDLTLDKDGNLYLTGYFSGPADFSPYHVDSNSGTNIDAFVAKIAKTQFRKGNSTPMIQSWSGSHSWSWKEEKFYQNEFEIPLATTVFINPIDSLIPGKKNHIWTLSDTETGNVIVKIKGVPYFIWTFINSGFYDIKCELEDSNGNAYSTDQIGKVRVIDHKEPKEGDIIPEIVTPEDYLTRSIYYTKENLGLPV